jgi:hypothetical protein
MKKQKYLIITIFAVISLLLVGISSTVTASPLGATAPNLGAASKFSALAGLSASSANTTTLSRNLGLYPGVESSKTGPWVIGGNGYYGPGTLAQDAQASALSAFNNLAGQGSTGNWAGGTSPAAGVWTEASDATFSGTLTLTGGYSDVWVFQIGRDLTFSGSVVLAGNAQACHVFWQVGRSATIASGTSFVGTLIASSDVTLVSGATVDGRILDLNGALTTDNNTISGPNCDSAPAAPTAVGGASATEASVSGLPGTGGAPLQPDGFPVAMLIVVGFSIVALTTLGVIAYRRNGQTRQ